MASILKVDDLRGNTSAGDITVTSEGGAATMQLQQGLAKQWATFDGTTNTVDDSFNVASLTDNSTGNYSANFTNNMSNGLYALSLTGSWNRSYGLAEARTTSYSRAKNANFSLTGLDADDLHHIVTGDLA